MKLLVSQSCKTLEVVLLQLLWMLASVSGITNWCKHKWQLHIATLTSKLTQLYMGWLAIADLCSGSPNDPAGQQYELCPVDPKTKVGVCPPVMAGFSCVPGGKSQLKMAWKLLKQCTCRCAFTLMHVCVMTVEFSVQCPVFCTDAVCGSYEQVSQGHIVCMISCNMKAPALS